MMAAGKASEQGARVFLIEKNSNLGVKLLITGKERCNITNFTPDVKEFTEKFGKNGKFLFSALHKFGVLDTIDFFENRNCKTKVERGNRVFPKSDKSQEVLDVLIKYLKENKVDIKTNSSVKDFILENNKIKKIILDNNEEITADKYVLCTGGKSYPGTGSTGDGYVWLDKFGHKTVKPAPSLSPVVVKEKYVKELEGLSLKNVEISIYKNNKKLDSRFGEAIFTANGMSGPIILDMSKKIGESLPEKTELIIDFKPALDFKTLDLRLQKDFQEGNNKMFRNILDNLLPKKLIPLIIRLSGISPNKQVNLVTHEERKKLLHLLKEFKLTALDLTGFSKAIVTAGGVDLSEVDPQTMQSKLISNLYFAGEILDLDGPTGGYNLQVCWSTGFVAGSI